MTPIEFKFWLQGFAENIDAYPTPAQWATIKEKLASLDQKESYMDQLRKSSVNPWVYPNNDVKAVPLATAYYSGA